MSLDEAVRTAVRDELRDFLDRLERKLGEGVAQDELLTVAQAAQLAKVQPATIRRWIREGQLQARGSRRTLRVVRSSVLSLDRRPNHETPTAVAARILGRAQ